MKYKKYPKYKDSGIEWLRKIPEHWDVRRLKRVVENYVNGIWGNEPIGVNDTIVIRVADFDYNKLKIKDTDFTKRNIKPEDKLKRKLKSGDLLIERSGGGDNQPVGRVVVFDKDFESVCSNFISKLTISKEVNNKFILYTFSHLYNTKINTKSIKQTTGIQNLDLEQYLLEKVPLPPLQEQKAIASFLDKAIAKIDSLIKKEEELIKLLEEKKEALITKVVTKGLKKVKLKNSGVEWLEEIPEHWEVRRLRYVAKIINGSTPSSKVDEYWNGNIIWITPKDFTKNKYLENSERKITKLGLQNCGAELVPKNSIIITTRAPIGNVAIAKQPLCTNQGCKSIIPLSIMTNYLYYYFTIISSVLNSLGTGTTFMELSSETLKDLSIPLPPLQEQKEIAEYLDKKLAQIDKLIQKSKKAIELLKEKKQALITNAVTGKIDVRENYEA